MKDFKKFSMYEDSETTASGSTNSEQPTEKTAEEKKRAERLFKLLTKEPDPEVQAWLRTVLESDYDLVSTVYKAIRYSGGTKAKVILHKAMQAYADQQTASLRQQLKEKNDHADTWKGEYQTARRQAEEFRKELKASQELNREMAEALQFVVENHGVKVTTVLKELIESLIQKYKGQ